MTASTVARLSHRQTFCQPSEFKLRNIEEEEENHKFFVFLFVCLFTPSFLHDCLDTCCFGCLICMCFVFLYLHLLRAIEHASHGKAL